MASGSRAGLGEWVFPTMDTPEGIKRGRKAGALASIYLGGSFLLTAILTGHSTLGAYGLDPDVDADTQRFRIAIVVFAGLAWFFAAYRVSKGKGGIAIWLVLAYAAYSVATKLAFAPKGPGVFLSLIAAGAAINGVRAILADRKIRMLSPPIGEPVPNMWRRRSKDFRLWVFGSIVWLVGTFLYVLLINPYRMDGFDDLSDRQLRQLIGILLLPPLLSAAVWFGYKRFVK